MNKAQKPKKNLPLASKKKLILPVLKKQIHKEEKNVEPKSNKDNDEFKLKKVKVKMIGLGGGGCSMLADLAGRLPSVSFLACDTDSKTFRKKRGIVKSCLLGENVCFGLGTGMNPELAEKAAVASKENLRKMIADQDLLIIIGALGGGVASGAGPVIAEIAQEQKILSLGIFTLPFEFEGERKMKTAQRAVGKLKEKLSGIIVVPNEKIFHLVDRKTPLKKAFATLNGFFCAWVDDLVELVLKPGLINVDFADLRTILRERNQNLFLSSSIAQGPNRVEDILKQIFSNPIFEQAPKTVSRILFGISGGKDIKLKEVEIISQAVANLNPKAKIIFGFAENSKLLGKIKVILLVVSEGERGEERQKPARRQAGAKSKNLPDSRQGRIEKKEEGKNKADKKGSAKNNKNKQEEMKKEKPRKTALEAKQEEEDEEEKEWQEGGAWEVPTFLRQK